MPTALTEAVAYGSTDITSFVTQHCNKAAEKVSLCYSGFVYADFSLRIVDLGNECTYITLMNNGKLECRGLVNVCHCRSRNCFWPRQQRKLIISSEMDAMSIVDEG